MHTTRRPLAQLVLALVLVLVLGRFFRPGHVEDENDPPARRFGVAGDEDEHD